VGWYKLDCLPLHAFHCLIGVCARQSKTDPVDGMLQVQTCKGCCTSEKFTIRAFPSFHWLQLPHERRAALLSWLPADERKSQIKRFPSKISCALTSRTKLGTGIFSSAPVFVYLGYVVIKKCLWHSASTFFFLLEIFVILWHESSLCSADVDFYIIFQKTIFSSLRKWVSKITNN